GVIPYFLLFTRTGAKGEWTELTLFGLRLALTFLCTLLGWVLTMRALAQPSGMPSQAATAGANLPPQTAPSGA
ncbi:MAG TPA: hypothetical protein VE775_00275, partial [Pyrinomonadaceae bacterium]|nr:hypothetical protein [Pyrinomonadaceae bacterium]